jgi:hypothetical protein
MNKQLSDECRILIDKYARDCWGDRPPVEVAVRESVFEILTNTEIYIKADLISKEDAFKFNEWCSFNEWHWNVADYRWYQSGKRKQYTSEELFNLYLNQKEKQ